jgi:hypothetical protein
MTHIADEMEVAGVSVGRFESRSALAKIDLAGNSGTDHPLERAVHGRTTDPRILFVDEIAQIICAQMTFLAQKQIQDAVAFAGPLATFGDEPGEVQSRVSTGRQWSDRTRVERPVVRISVRLQIANFRVQIARNLKSEINNLKSQLRSYDDRN